MFSVEITELRDNTFYANLRLVRGGNEIIVSARPSDAVALALRVGAPILVSDDLMAAEGKIMQLSSTTSDERRRVRRARRARRSRPRGAAARVPRPGAARGLWRVRRGAYLGRHLLRLRRHLHAEPPRDHRRRPRPLVDYHDHDAPSTTSTTTTTCRRRAPPAGAATSRASTTRVRARRAPIYASVTLTKTTTGTCTLKGWPILTLQDKPRRGAADDAPVDVPNAPAAFSSWWERPPNSPPRPMSRPHRSRCTRISRRRSPWRTPTCRGHAGVRERVTLSVQFSAGGATVSVTPSSPIQPCNNGQIWLSPFYAAS